MADIWGKLLLAGLAGVVGWRAIGPKGQREVTEALNLWAEEMQREKQEEQRQNERAMIAQAISNMPMPPAPVIPALPTPVAPKLAAALEPDLRWREVIVPPAVILILGKRGSGKSALAYRLLELCRYRLTPYVVVAPAQTNK